MTSERFPVLSLAEAFERASRTERWVFHEVISSSITTLYGPSNVGKSYLVASMLLSLMVDGREFLGMQPVDESKDWRPAILCTDPGSPEEYAQRIYAGVPDANALDVPMYRTGMTKTPEEWRDLTSLLIGTGRNFVVLDNLNGSTGDPNDTAAATVVYDGLDLLVSRGIPVVVLHHETEKYATKRGAAPMGTGVPVQKSRAWIQVRQTARRRLRGGNTGLYVQGNGLAQPAEIIAQPLAGPDYRVLSHGPVEPEEQHEEAGDESQAPAGRERGRKALTDAQAAAMAAVVAQEWPEKSGRAVAGELAKRFPGVLTESTAQTHMTGNGKIRRRLQREGDRWSLR
ncbi:AAA family ATPase [Actinomycetospora corticicola]|uniref:AAA domain-containing protein n=1 Tax=Actinomycetospora corticicola TaxID=663602 RepID=A0A7Y9DYA2_9PSEU|nr:hypothetical protein [Actinomycetospora corticicola]